MALATIVLLGNIAAPPTIGFSFIICAKAAELPIVKAAAATMIAKNFFISFSPYCLRFCTSERYTRRAKGSDFVNSGKADWALARPSREGSGVRAEYPEPSLTVGLVPRGVHLNQELGLL